MIDRDELAAWLRLVATPGVGRDTARRLLAQFGSPEGVLGASTAARRPLTGEATATALATEPEGFAQLLAATRAWLAARPAGEPGGRDVLVLGDPRYPRALLETADPPTLLYVDGRIELLQADSIAIVAPQNPQCGARFCWIEIATGAMPAHSLPECVRHGHCVAAKAERPAHMRGAQCRVAGEGHFIGWREDAHQRGGALRRQDERRFGQIHLPGQRLHGGGVELTAIFEHA